MTGMVNMVRKTLIFLSLFGILLSSCGLPVGNAEPTAAPTKEIIPPVPTATPAPRELTVCLGEEPNTLYPFGGPNAAARSVMAAVFDGPIDMVGYDYQPVILSQIPSFADGDAQIISIAVQPGGQVVDAKGISSCLNWVLLSARRLPG